MEFLHSCNPIQACISLKLAYALKTPFFISGMVLENLRRNYQGMGF